MIVARLASRRRDDGGETLIEILIALVITGIVMVGLVSGLTTVIVASDTHRHLTDVEVVARQYGEALVNQAYHPATATLASDNCTSDDPPVCSTSLSVTNVTGTFPDAPFYIAIDAEVLHVISKPGNTWTLDAKPREPHAEGAQITYDVVDDACANSARLQPTTYVVPSGVAYIDSSSISMPLVEFFDSTGIAITGGCADYWKSVLPCSEFATAEHLTECDPALIRVTIGVRTTAASPHEADTTTRVLIRRGDA